MPVVAVTVENLPVDIVVAPIGVPSIEPPVIATVLAFCVDIVPKPVIAVLGIVVDAVTALVPFPYRYPDKVVAPVPPFATGNAVPESVTSKVPLEVIGEPVTDRNEGTVIATEVTVPPAAGVAEIVIPPAVLEMLTFVPAVKLASVYPEPLPIASWPLVGVAVKPVPP